MKKQSSQHPASNFWFGFALGTVAVAAGAYFFGTKQGRRELKRVLDFTENFEENIHSVGEDFERELIEKKNELVEHLEDVPQKICHAFADSEGTHSSLHSLLDKIKLFSPSSEKYPKKLFVKEK